MSGDIGKGERVPFERGAFRTFLSNPTTDPDDALATLHPLTRWNPPGRKQLKNRAATFAVALEQMLAEMRNQPNLQLNADDSQNWAIALMQSWARVIDVLTFYQERLVNERFLGTAREPRSIRELLGMVGIEPQPGLAARTYLAFTVRSPSDKLAKIDPHARALQQNVLIPAGTQVQSVPTAGRRTIGQTVVRESPAPAQMPQIFETAVPFEARAEWNLLRPANAMGMRWLDLRRDCQQLRAAGVKTDVRPGDALLLVGEQPQAGQSAPTRLAFVHQVEPRAKLGYTLITLEPAEPSPPQAAPTAAQSDQLSREPISVLRTPMVYAFRENAQLRAFDQTGVHFTAPEQCNWMPCGLGLPNTPIYDLIRTSDGTLLAASDKGIFRSTDDGDTWVAASTGLLQSKIRALVASQNDKVYAGSEQGKLFVSLDDGQSWQPVAPKPQRQSIFSRMLPFLRDQSASLPKAAISKLDTLPTQNQELLIAATEQGTFISTDGGVSWNIAPETKSKPAAAWALATGAARWSAVAGTDDGVVPVMEDASLPGLSHFNKPAIVLSQALLIAIAVLVLALAVGGWNNIPNALLYGEWTVPFRPYLGVLLARWTFVALGLNVLLIGAFVFILGLRSLLARRSDFMRHAPSPGVRAGTGWAYQPDTIRLLLIAIAVTLVLIVLGGVMLGLTMSVFDKQELADLSRPDLENNRVLQLAFNYSEQFGLGWDQIVNPILASGIVVLPLVGVTAIVALVLFGLLRRARIQENFLPPLGMAVHAVVASPDNTLIAGTEKGAQRWDDTGKRWTSFSRGLLKKLMMVRADEAANLDKGVLSDELLQAFSDKQIDIADNAIIRVEQPGAHWTIRDSNQSVIFVLLREGEGISVNRPDESDLRAMVVNEGVLYTGTGDGRVYRVGNRGWELCSHNLNLAEVHGLLPVADGFFAAGTPPNTNPDAQWTRFHLRKRLLDLNKIFSIATGSQIVLQNQGHYAVCQVTSVEEMAGRGGRRIGSFSRVGVDCGEDLATFDRTTSQVWVQEDALAPFDSPPLQGNEIILDKSVAGLKPGQMLILGGKPIRLQVTDEHMLVSSKDFQTRRLVPGTELAVIAPPSSTNGELLWELSDADGFTGQVGLKAGQFIWVPAQDEDGVVAESVIIANVDQQATTVLTLANAVGSVYDRSTVVLYGNVVPATHGQSVVAEVLGSGNTSIANQTFRLQRQPLSFVETNGAIAPDSLHVKVNDIEWPRVESLTDLAPHERGYSVRQDAQGNATIVFGDDAHGARLPQGFNNISATYRYGSGQAGNVPANSLTLVRTRLPGVTAVTNPLAANGGVDAELTPNLDNLIGLKAAQRCVSLNDYRNASLAFPGIAKAQVEFMSVQDTPMVYVTVAGKDKPLERDSAPTSALEQYLEQNQANPDQPVQVKEFESVSFNLAADVLVDEGMELSNDQIKTALAKALVDRFGFNARELGQPVVIAELVAALQSFPGVRAVKVLLFYVMGQAETLNERIQPLPARIENGNPLPAQLVLINGTLEQGIILRLYKVESDEWTTT